jgi:DNA replicative helicase MCM subunit Mcm2 (Cdc46/Mcm family)
LIRLSEALAKIYASEEVLIQHVTEASYLLKTSIVTVEQDEISMEAEMDHLVSQIDTTEFDHAMREDVCLSDIGTNRAAKKDSYFPFCTRILEN